MSKVRVGFLGTPDFAVSCLRGLLEDEHFDVVGVVTQPDRPSGRKMLMTPSPVKSLAEAKGLRVISPESVNRELILQEVQKWGAEIAIVVAFGQIVSQKFLDSFRLGCVNVHASLLPRWRGAAPIQRAVAAGDEISGVVLQKMVKELDAGDVLGARQIPIYENMNAKELHDQLALLGSDLLRVELMDYVRGNLAPLSQDPKFVTYAKKIEKSEAEIKWSNSAVQIHNQVRAFVMGPGTWVSFQGKKLKIHRTEIESKAKSSHQAGEIVSLSSDTLSVATGEGLLKILEVQPESRNRMLVSDFLKGHSLKKGDRLV